MLIQSPKPDLTNRSGVAHLSALMRAAMPRLAVCGFDRLPFDARARVTARRPMENPPNVEEEYSDRRDPPGRNPRGGRGRKPD
jgi:hypothetical protein